MGDPLHKVSDTTKREECLLRHKLPTLRCALDGRQNQLEPSMGAEEILL